VKKYHVMYTKVVNYQSSPLTLKMWMADSSTNVGTYLQKYMASYPRSQS